MSSADIIELFDVLGTAAFALSGATVAARRGLDVFGVLVLALVTAVAGGIMRDVLIGAVPPASIRNWHMPAVALAMGLAVFCAPALLERLRSPVQLFDAAGLGIFAVTGTQKALEFGIPAVTAVMLGMVTAIGGGMVRDVLTAEVPAVLHEQIYAGAALAGGAVVVAGHLLGMPIALTLLPGALLCCGLRLVAIRRGWRLPHAGDGIASRSK